MTILEKLGHEMMGIQQLIYIFMCFITYQQKKSLGMFYLF